MKISNTQIVVGILGLVAIYLGYKKIKSNQDKKTVATESAKLIETAAKENPLVAKIEESLPSNIASGLIMDSFNKALKLMSNDELIAVEKYIDITKNEIEDDVAIDKFNDLAVKYKFMKS